MKYLIKKIKTLYSRYKVSKLKPWKRPIYSEFNVCGVNIATILSCLGYCVGFGNLVWFPYKASQNGGGPFLIAYFIILFTVGIPAVFLELIYGQYTGSGVISVFNAIPLFKGVGWGLVYISFTCSWYYRVIAGIF